MNYSVNLGIWNSVFAVPCDIVDNHLRLAGAAQLKVILWFLRHSGESFTDEEAASALGMQPADFRDSMQYWVQTGILSVKGGVITPATVPAEKPSAPVEADQPAEPDKKAKRESGKSRALSRPEKPDAKYIARRVTEDKSIEYLMQSADEIFGRMSSNNDRATLMLIHEYDGLPVEVIIMLLQYANSIGKCNMKYIEKMAISWAEEEINTLEKADKKIKRMSGGREAARKVQKIFGLEEHSPSEKEIKNADRWVNEWSFSPDMLRKAYEVCIDAKSKYLPGYVDSILSRWHDLGYTLTSQVTDERKPKSNRKKESFGATYDINEYEQSSVIDEEW